MTTYVDQQAKHWGLPVPGHLKHGQNTYAMQVYGCDCTLCLPSGKRHAKRGEAKSAIQRQRESRQRLLGKPVPPGVKHGPYAYRTYGCRCDVCQAERRAALRRTQEAKKKNWHGHWEEREDGITVVHWPSTEPPWPCPVCDFKKIEEA